jgi:hypothetical protein
MAKQEEALPMVNVLQAEVSFQASIMLREHGTTILWYQILAAVEHIPAAEQQHPLPSSRLTTTDPGEMHSRQLRRILEIHPTRMVGTISKTIHSILIGRTRVTREQVRLTTVVVQVVEHEPMHRHQLDQVAVDGVAAETKFFKFF